MQARTTWLSDTEKALVYDEALVLLERVGLRMAGSAPPRRAARRGSRRRRRVGRGEVPGRARRQAASPVSARDRHGRRRAGQRRRAGRRRAVALLFVGLRGADARPPHRRASRLHARRPAQRDHPARRDARSRRAVDDRDRQRRAARAPREARLLHRPLRDRQARDLRRLPQRDEPVLEIVEVLCGSLRAFRLRPRISTLFTVASPLSIDGHLLDFHASLADFGTPVKISRCRSPAPRRRSRWPGWSCRAWPSCSARSRPCRS